ncbi:unnamed protein product [Lactuca virosa]|uniref:N-acetyltransferase domain-containing protein n=1 Tax=Lactuca virosa TaxID=75947 RepID=A0AAU9NAQ0_9ASTR|nr:unnamed protein product [Lactuca virosa]
MTQSFGCNGLDASEYITRGKISLPFRSPLRLRPPITHHPRKLSFTAVSSSSGYAISDQELESRGFIFRRTINDLNLDHLNSIFVVVGFPKRDTDKIKVALEHTDSLLWVEYEKTKRPVAFARATGDGVFNAIIWDVVVDPNFQGIGLGKAVIEREWWRSYFKRESLTLL